MRFLPFTVLLAACGLSRSPNADTATESSSDNGYSWGSAGSSSYGSTTEDDSGTATDSGTDDSGGLPGTDDTGTADSGLATGPIDAWVYVFENTADANVCLYGIADATTGDYSDYNSGACSTTDGSKGNGWLHQPVTYTPGEVLSMNGAWSDGTTNQRYLAEAGDLLTNVTYILIVFEDGTYDMYSIGTSDEVGDAYIKDSGSYHDWMIVTTDHTTGDYTM